jgi:hypothetical protein
MVDEVSDFEEIAVRERAIQKGLFTAANHLAVCRMG